MPTQRRRPTRRAEAGDRSRPPPAGESEGERLQRVLARAGFGSRRSTEELIRDGRVAVNGRVAELGRRIRADRDHVTIDGVPIPADPELRYYALNKPSGVTSTLSDPHAEESLAGYLPRGPRVVPVGRLDRDSEGLLLLTNDGELAFRLQHPRFGVEKEYLAEVTGEVSREAVRALTNGVELDDGVARAVRAGGVRRAHGRSSLSVVMTEGRKREVRRMLRALGYPVRRLVRVRQGPIRLGRLAPGEWRELRPDEVGDLYRAVQLERAAVRRPGARGRAVVHHRRR
jgi:23S rRNA pseudouridine2605 synthase